MWAAFIVFCAGIAASSGLSCGDDGWFAVIAKSLASGIGYATTFASHYDVAQPQLFNPHTGTGPALIVPCALVLRMFGISDVIPGLTAVALWGGVISIVLWRLSRRVSGVSFVSSVSLFCLSIAATFSYTFEHWYAFLGEATAGALLLLGHWIAAMEKNSRSSALLAGLALGLAVQAKQMAVFASFGALLIAAVRYWRSAKGDRRWWVSAVCLLAGCAAPTIVFEIYKLTQLGTIEYVANFRQTMDASREMAGSGSVVPFSDLGPRLTAMQAAFGVNLIVLVVLIGLAVTFRQPELWRRWALLAAGLFASALCGGTYWLLLSIGRPRYLAMAVVLGCFALSVPVMSLLRRRNKAVFALLAILSLSSGLSRITNIVHAADNGIFRISTQRRARLAAVAKIVQLKQEQPVALVSRWWASFVDLDFDLPGTMNFRRIEAVDALPGAKIFAGNRLFIDENDPTIRSLRQRTKRLIFLEPPYEVTEFE